MRHDDRRSQQAADYLRAAIDVVVFTGAGISAESGIPTFRDADGFWTEFPPHEFATWKGLIRTAVVRPSRLAAFVHAVLGPIAAAGPNAAHRALADLERHTRVTVVTQNIDNLHQDAGSTIVHEVHGSLFEIVNRRGRFVTLISRDQMQRITRSLERAQRSWLPLPRVLLAGRRLVGIGRRGIYRPKVVLFGDAMAEPAWRLALEATRACDCLIQVGCSGVVMPAAQLPLEAKAAGARVITIDPNEASGDVWLKGSAADVLPALVAVAFGDLNAG